MTVSDPARMRRSSASVSGMMRSMKKRPVTSRASMAGSGVPFASASAASTIRSHM